MQIQWKYGLLCGAFSILVLVSFLEGLHPIPYLIYAVLGVCIVLALRQQKQAQVGLLHFNEGVKTGLAVTVVGAAMVFAATFLYLSYINPEWLDAQKKLLESKAPQLEKSLRAQGKQPHEVQEMLKNARAGLTPSRQALAQLAAMGLPGAVITVVASLIMRRKG